MPEILKILKRIKQKRVAKVVEEVDTEKDAKNDKDTGEVANAEDIKVSMSTDKNVIVDTKRNAFVVLCYDENSLKPEKIVRKVRKKSNLIQKTAESENHNKITSYFNAKAVKNDPPGDPPNQCSVNSSLNFQRDQNHIIQHSEN